MHALSAIEGEQTQSELLGTGPGEGEGRRLFFVFVFLTSFVSRSLITFGTLHSSIGCDG